MIRWASRIQGPIAVIGDVHGQVNQLRVVLDKLAHVPDYDDRWIIFIGDLVDRGPDTRAVLDTILDLIREHPRTTAVMGNHELAMCGALGWLPTPEYCQWPQRWVTDYSSESTFASYGVPHGDLEQLAKAVPEQHRELLTALPWCIEHPRLFFVHAGLDPLQPLSLQLPVLQHRDFTLNRPPWLSAKNFATSDPPPDCPLMVVSGHVPVPRVLMRPRRLLIDTTGGMGGDLSCVLMPEQLLLDSTPGPPQAILCEEPEKKPWWKLW